MEKKKIGEAFEIYSNFWLGVASAGARGFADIAKALQERKERGFDSATAAAALKTVLGAAANSLKSVAEDAATVETEFKDEKSAHGSHGDRGK